MKPKSKRPILKRIGLALLIPFCLFLLGGILSLFGGKATQSIDQLLTSVWLPLTAVRFVVYSVITYVIVPIVLTNKQHQANNNICDLELIIADVPPQTEEYANIQAAINWENARVKVYSNYIAKRHWIFVVFTLLDLMTVQFPYFLRG